MGSLRLVPLLASLHMLLRPASPAGNSPALPPPPPPPPNITVTPEKTEYLIGDAVAIQCSAPPSARKILGFQFSGTSGWAAEVRTGRRSATYRFNVTGPRDGGAHACTYAVADRYRQRVRSRESAYVSLSVRDRPPAPTLELTPASGVTVEGQPLVLLCGAPEGRAERRFRFYGEREELGGAQAEARLRLAASGSRHTGNVSCGYEEETEGRWIPSHRSRALRVLVKEAAPAPRLAVDPAGGVVSEAYPLRLTCAAARADFALRFRFYRDGAELRAGQEGARGRTEGARAHLLFPRSPRGFGGQFSCGAEEDVGGTWVPAPRSPGVEVTVKDLPPPPALLSDPPSGEVPEGAPLLLTCAAAGPGAPRRFVFYRDGAEQFVETAARDRALFSVPAANGSRAGGRFTCRYEEKVGDSWIPSPVSRALTVVPQARPRLVPLAAGCAAASGAALLLGLLLAACLCRRRRGGVHWKGLREKDDPGAYAMAGVSGSDEG